ncbi:MT-A70 family methyltransferase [Nocardia fluminea]|uniref:MT-A70 family methyltransferase n=1 Tax=Nocardia fluminea TaxID=134984 RepID=UPI003658E3CF
MFLARNSFRNPKQYRTILADPPWRSSGTAPPDSAVTRGSLNLDQFKALPVSELAEADAYLWMWCTNATLRTAYEVLQAWDFDPRAPLTWIKPCPGLDTHLRSSVEHLILGTRGNAEINDHGQPAWMFAPTHDDSCRSDEEYAIIERVSTGPFLELFTDTPRAGWDTIDLDHPPIDCFSSGEIGVFGHRDRAGTGAMVASPLKPSVRPVGESVGESVGIYRQRDLHRAASGIPV